MKKLWISCLFLSTLSSCGTEDKALTPFEPPSEMKLCEVRVAEELLIERPDLDELDASFANVRQHLFTQYCHSCHSEGGYSPDLNNEQDTLTYVTPGSPQSSLLYTSIAERRMPPSLNLPENHPAALRLLRRWIESLN